MSQTISSAEPLKLLRYSDMMALVDDALGAEANRLGAALEHFEATCREPAFRLHVSQAADALIQYGQQARGTDLWVRDVAVGFQLADGGGMYGPVAGGAAGFLWAGGEASAGGSVRSITDAVKQWLLEHGGEYTDDIARGQALLNYLGTLVDTPAERELISDLIDKVEDLKDYNNLVKDVEEIADELDTVRGVTYPGQLIIYGGFDLKSSIGWSEHLTHLKLPTTGSFSTLLLDGNLLKLSGQSALHEGREALLPSTKLGVAFTLISIGFTAGENWDEYKDEGVQKVVCGTVVDSALDIGLSAAGAASGAFVGGTLLGAGLGAISGGTLAPVGVAIGGKVGGVLGSMAGSWVADKIEETQFDEWATDQLDTGIDKATDWAGDTLADASEATGEALSDASAAMGATLDSAASTIDGALSSAVQSVGGWF